MSENVTTDGAAGMDKILDRIAKLLQLAAKNPNAEEAAAAAAKAQSMMDQYNIEAGTVERAQGTKDGKREEAAVSGGFYIYQRTLYRRLAELNFCMYWCQDRYVVLDPPKWSYNRKKWLHGMKKSEHVLIGRAVNVAATKALATYILNAVDKLCRERLTNSAGGYDFQQLFSVWGISFREGAIENVLSRLRERREKDDIKRAAEAKRRAKAAGHATGNALTIADIKATEAAGNYDFLHGEGAWAQRLADKAAHAAELKAHREAMAQLAIDNPKEYARLEEEERKARRRSYSGGGSYRERPRDYSAYNSGHTAGESISLDAQVDTPKPTVRIGK